MVCPILRGDTSVRADVIESLCVDQSVSRTAAVCLRARKRLSGPPYRLRNASVAWASKGLVQGYCRAEVVLMLNLDGSTVNFKETGVGGVQDLVIR